MLDTDSESMQKYQAATDKAEANKDDIDALAAKVDTATTNANDINAKVLDKVSTYTHYNVSISLYYNTNSNLHISVDYDW